MSHRVQHRLRPEITIGTACDSLEAVLDGGTRSSVLDAIQRTGDFDDALARLRSAMRSHIFPTTGEAVALQRIVQSLDARTRAEGFHVLESWDYRAERFARDTVPVLMLDRCAGAGIAPLRQRAALAILLDQYFLSLLGLLAARAWDADDPDDALARVTRLLWSLQEGEAGHRFVDDAETLLLLAVSHYHPDEEAYPRLLGRVAMLRDESRHRLALSCAAILGSHLRWGFRFMYRRDVSLMRSDNAVDYPWLLFAILTLAREYRRMRENGATAADRAPLVDALVSGLSADPWALAGKPPACLEASGDAHAEVRATLGDYRCELLEDFQTVRPGAGPYSPLGFESNFLCNALVAMVATALEDDTPHASLNELHATRTSRGACGPAVERYARLLMTYAAGTGRTAGRPALIVYDPYEAHHAFNTTVQVLGGMATGAGASRSC